tara:strand:+ start:3665 stop:3934 length:270 start_codon:yes stop_codon:yes gene_type:complete
MKVLCINDTDKPVKISEENWIKQGKIYTVIEVTKMGLQKGQLGYKLAEVSIPEKSFPYEYYSSSRFGFLIEITDENPEISTKDADLDIF